MSPRPHSGPSRPITVALVNNMPDAAFVDTEHQFRRAVGAEPESDLVDIGLYTIPGLNRSDAVAAEIRSRYRGLEDLWSTRPDALIITGTEPVQARLEYEPYWPHLSQLLKWAADTVPTSLLSCLASHASLLMFDGIERQPLAVRCTGVFDSSVEPAGGPLVSELPAVVSVPHSRVNDVPEQALVKAGYTIVVGRGEAGAGWSVATRTQGVSTFVMCQGHLEYSTESLLREYRRDVRRCLFGRGAVPYPTMPSGYFDPESTKVLEQYADEVMSSSDSDPVELYQRFPYEQVSARLGNRWSDSSAIFYRNWLELANAPVGAS